MRRCVVLIALLVTLSYGCRNNLHPIVQQPLLGFHDLRWGDTQKDVKMKLLNEKDVKYRIEYSDSCELIFEGDEFCGIALPTYSFSFVGGKFYRVFITVIGSSNYPRIVGLLKRKYGKPTYISNDKILMSTSWDFIDSSTVFCSPSRLNTDIYGSVLLFYTYKPLEKIVQNREYQKKIIEREKSLKSL